MSYAGFGSEGRQRDKSTVEHLGPSPDSDVVMMTGGAGAIEDEAMTPVSSRDDQHDHTSEQCKGLQCRLGNPRNCCYANSPSRLWAWAGRASFQVNRWNNAASAVQTALADNDTVQITSLSTLQFL